MFTFKTRPYKHQMDALQESCVKDEYALLKTENLKLKQIISKIKAENSLLKAEYKEYKESDLSDEQKMMINHIADLDKKIWASEFNLVQLSFGIHAFLDALQVDLKNPKPEEDKSEESKNGS